MFSYWQPWYVPLQSKKKNGGGGSGTSLSVKMGGSWTNIGHSETDFLE